jgi:hypothetical protein
MNTTFPSKNSASRRETLRVAISTDTILYTPFFLAYNSGDFEDTPFGKLSVNIIGTLDDIRFDTTKKLKGDGFATFCLLLNLADAAICDPSYLVYLSDANVATITNEFRGFEELLTSQTKKKLVTKFPTLLKIENDVLIISHTDQFKKIFENKKVIGGLISKIAFSVAVSPDLNHIVNSTSYKEAAEKFGFEHRKNAVKKSFIENEITGKFIYYKQPSTGNCLGVIHAKNYNKFPINEQTADFGTELNLL